MKKSFILRTTYFCRERSHLAAPVSNVAQIFQVPYEEQEEPKRSTLTPYKCPRWASKLKNVPQYYIELAQKPTPIQEWDLSEVPNGFNVHIKRDDLTGHLLSGNKIRKLEFLFADAIIKNSTCVITCGGLQSNHCRATAIAAKQLGLGCHLLLRSHNQDEDAKICSANMLLSRIHGAECYTVPYQSLAGGLNARLYKLADQLRAKGERPYIIPLGGSDYLGGFGIINAFKELMEQGLFSNYDDIVVAAGSGGTLAGLSVANYLTGQKLSIHGVCVSDNAEYFYRHVQETLLKYGLIRENGSTVCDVMEGYKGQGYAKTTESDLDQLVKVCQQSGILLDYSYTLKAVNGMLTEMKVNPQRFKGNRVLYVHTGGSFSIFDGLINNAMCRSEKVHAWKDINENPLKT